MGWLRDMMEVAEPPLSSYGLLAERCLEHPAWPSGNAPKPRSLASLFSKFDRGIELEWLADREGVQHVLGSILGRPVAEVQRCLQGVLREDEARTSRYRLLGAPQARPLDLKSELLPPGLPALLAFPRRWQRFHWKTTGDEAAELVAAWLEARSLANVVRATDVEQAAAGLEPESPNFVVLPTGFESAASWGFSASGLCVAAPFVVDDAGLQRIESPSPQDFAEPLAEWLAPRLPTDSRFEVSTAVEWLAGYLGQARDFETVLGLLSLVDELGVSSLRGKSLHSLATAFVQRQIARGRGGADVKSWLDQQALKLLLGIARRCATESNLPFGTARTRDQWLGLVPQEFESSIDAEWAKASLLSAGAPLSVDQLERTLSRLPPGAFRAVHALESAGLLASRGVEMRPEPRWLVGLLEQQARREILASSPYEWGEALLRGHDAQALHAALMERFLDDDYEAVEAVLEYDEPTNPAAIIALEVVTLNLGLTILHHYGANLETSVSELELPEPNPELLSALWQQQEKVLVSLDGERKPRFLGPDYHGAFRLSSWTIVETLQQAGLQVDEGGPLSGAVLDEVAAFLDQAPPEPWVFAAYGVIGRALDERVPCASTDAGHPAGAPWALLRDIRWIRVRQLALLQHGVAALRSLCQPHRGWPETAASLWTCWDRAGRPETTLFNPEQAWASLLWPHLPLDVLQVLCAREHELVDVFPFALLTSVARHRVFEVARELSDEAFAHADKNSLGAALGAAIRLRHVGGMTRLFQRFPDSCFERLEVAFESDGDAELAVLLTGVPAKLRPAVVDVLSRTVERLGVARRSIDPVRRWLLDLCSRRAEGFRDAYALLDEIEQRLERAMRARGRV